jgi:prevent-host-death family protein
MVMDFVTVRELRAESGKVWEKLEAGQDVVITRNGKPFAVVGHTEGENLETTLRAIRAERFRVNLARMQQHAVELGLDKMTMEEIDAEIASARRERQARNEGSH